MKVIVGAGGTELPGWVSLDQSELDITQPAQWARLFKPGSLSMILAEHVWEHLTFDQGLMAALNCYSYLKPRGNLRIAVPDGYHSDRRYVRWVAPGIGYNGDDHKVLYNYHSLSRLLTSVGFNVNCKEWFDERRRLHTLPMDYERGYVKRYSRSFWANVLSLFLGFQYTSLVIDAVKPR